MITFFQNFWNWLRGYGFGPYILVSWAESTPDVRFTIFRGTDNIFTSAGVLAVKITGNSYEDKAVIRGTTYYYWVEAVSVAGVDSAVVGPVKATI
jgi:fibronectin type 3 domain-containing protein